MRTDRERVTLALDTLVAGLFPYMETAMKAAFQDGWLRAARSSFRDRRTKNVDGEVIRWDAHATLTVIWDQWNRVFRHKLEHHHRSLVSELREFRNRWAHQMPFDFDDTYRLLDSVERLLNAVGSQLSASIHREKRDLLRAQFTREAKNTYRKSQLNRQKWKDLCIYAVCGMAIVTVILQLFGLQAWVVAGFVIFVFAYLANQRFHSVPPMIFGPHECGTCAKIIYGEQCPYCDPVPAKQNETQPDEQESPLRGRPEELELLDHLTQLQQNVASPHLNPRPKKVGVSN